MDHDKIFGVGNKPTEEQALIGEAYLRGEDICIEARAGASKSTTSVMLSYMDSSKRILYTAFNKKVIEDGKDAFNYNTDCRTTHSLAYRAIGHKYQHKLSRPRGAYKNVAGTIAEISRYFKIKDIEGCNSYRIASFVTAMVGRFEASADDFISRDHLPMNILNEFLSKPANKGVNKKELLRLTTKYAKALWKEKADITSPVICSHDSYLKLYQLSKPKIEGYDVIISDESQDATPCVIDIILQQTHLQKVLIGDSHQAIYQWRGCVNMFENSKLKDYTKLELSKSFRFGQNLADLAKIVLGGKININGHDVPTKLEKIPENTPYTIVYRTNANLIMDALELIGQGKSVKMEVDVRDFTKLLLSIVTLMSGGKPKHADIMVYSDVDEFLLDCEYNPEFKRLLGFVKSGQAYRILDALQDYKVPSNPDVTLITAFKAKGMTIDHVKLSEDFVSLLDDHGNLSEKVHIGEVNLLYVALTRAKYTLETNPQIEELREYYKDKANVQKEIKVNVKSLGYFSGDTSSQELDKFISGSVNQDHLLDVITDERTQPKYMSTGDMASMNLDMQMTNQMLAEQYCAGEMGLEEAYDNGFINEQGVEVEGIQEVWDDKPFGSLGTLESELEKECLRFDVIMQKP